MFLEIPYSQSSGFFGNLTIYHELGHFVWDSLLEQIPRRPAFQAVIDGLEDGFEKKLSMHVTTPKGRDLIKSAYEAWAQELFCDLLALRHIGPAASFALVDVLSLFGLMEDENAVTFNEKHPASVLRIREQLHQLKTDGWWKCVKDLRSEHVGFMERLAHVKESEYKFVYRDADLPRQILEPFLEVVPQIRALAVDVTPSVQSRADDFRIWQSSLEDCLVNGIVPSKLLDGGTTPVTPVSMINAAYCVYLARVPELMGKLEDQEFSNPEHRKKWIERLEDWTMKAVDDYYLLRDCSKI